MHVGNRESEIEKVAHAAIRGMVGAVGTETISPHVMIDAALHVLAAWVASSQTHSPVDEREEEIEELVEILPSYIEYHRSAGWLPETRAGVTIRVACSAWGGAAVMKNTKKCSKCQSSDIVQVPGKREEGGLETFA